MSMYRLSFLLVLLYIFLFGRLVTEEFSLWPGWLYRMNQDPVSTPPSEVSPRPFKFSEYYGYFIPDGRVIFSGKMLYDVAIDENGFID